MSNAAAAGHMNQASSNGVEAMAILKRMFDAEMGFMRSAQGDLNEIANIFHPNVVIHEPSSLPYAGDWRGHAAVGRLFRSMHDTWRSMSVENMRATLDGDVLFMSCTLVAQARVSGKEIRQPFAEILRIEDGLVMEGTPYYYDTAEICAALR